MLHECHACMHARAHTHTHSRIRHAHTYTRTHAHTRTHTYTYTHAHTHTHAHIYVQHTHSMGVLMWELFTGQVPWDRSESGHFKHSPGFKKFPPGTPAGYVCLAQQVQATKYISVHPSCNDGYDFVHPSYSDGRTYVLHNR